MKERLVWVEVDEADRAIRIVRNPKSSFYNLKKIPRQKAVAQIRRQIWERSGGYCEKCHEVININSFHMHEEIPRGLGGEISVANSIALCAFCHIGPSGAHKNRRPMFSGREHEV